MGSFNIDSSDALLGRTEMVGLSKLKDIKIREKNMSNSGGDSIINFIDSARSRQ
jgi:hypothetical protein